MSTTFAKKAFAVASTSALVLASFASFASAAVHSAGTNVSVNGTVYFIDPTGVRRGYTSGGAFLSYGFNSWSQVVPASAEDLALPTGSFVPPMDGSLINDMGTIYVINNGQRSGITTMDVFNGQGYKLSNVVNGDTSFMTSSAITANSSSQHLVGTLVNQSGTIYLITLSGKMGIPTESVFNSWGYSYANTVTANNADNALPMSSGIMQARVMGQLNPTGSTTVVVPPTSTGNVSASLSNDNPASGAVVTTQAAADLAHFTFTGNGAVTAVSLKRIGISADASIGNVYLYDGNTRLTDATSVAGNSIINFTNSNGLFTVNGSKTISVKADLAALAGETIGVQLVSAATGSTAVGGTPVSANLMTTAAATLAGVSFGAITPSAASLNPANDQIVWQSTATVSTRDVLLSRLAMQEIGSINYASIQNFRLFVDGNLLSTVANLDANGYVTFVPSTSFRMTTGAHIVKVLADVISGSSRTFIMSVRTKADIGLVDTQYNAGVATTSSVPLSSGTQTISSGSLTIQKTVDSPSNNVTLNASDVSMARWTFTAYGEPIKITALTVQAVMATNVNIATSLKNGRLLFNGQQFGSTQNVATGSAGTSYTVNYTVNPGTPVTVEFRADANGNVAIANNDTININILADTNSNGQGTVSGTTFNAPGSLVTANTVTVASGTISIAKTSSYGSQTTVAPQTAYKLADMQVSGNSTEDVNVNTITAAFTGAGTFTVSKLNNVYILWNGVRESVTKSTVAATANTWSVNHVLAKNTTAQVQIFSDIAAGITAADTMQATVTVSGTTAQSAASVTTASLPAQLITVNTGTIAATLDASAPITANLANNTTSTVAAYKFSSTNDSYTITDVTVTLAAASTVNTVALRDGSTVLSTKPGSTSVTFSGLSVMVPANGTKVLALDLQLGTVGVGAGTSGEAVTATLTSFKSVSSTGTTATATPGTVANAQYVYKALPTVTNVALPSTILTAGTQVLYRFSVNTNGTGSIGLNKVSFQVTKTSAPTLASFALYNADTNTQVAGTLTGPAVADVTGGTPLVGTFNATSTGGLVTFTSTAEEQISGARTYELRATVAGSLVSGDSVVTNIPASGLGHVAPAAAASVGATATFVWSDQSAAAHSLTTTDWNNDNLVRNIPTPAQALIK